MKSKELIEILSTAPEAEVGFEHIKITNAWVDSDKYIELDGQIAKCEYENNQSVVFAVVTEYEDAPAEVNAIYHQRERADKLKTWLEKCKSKEDNGYANIKSVKIQNMFILK